MTSVLDNDLRNRRGPVLSDGTSLSDLIDFDNREVSMRVLVDPQVYQLELKRIFSRSWIGLAHTSEIPGPGDYVLRHIGLDPVIVTRDNDGEVHVLLNACAHRGMEVCWADRGTTNKFECPYHGWSYNNGGDLVGAPFHKKVYGDLDKSRYGLLRARVAIRHGLIFATFSDTIVGFEEYLGGLGWYFDLMYGDTEWEVLGPPARYLVHHNWKIVADQHAGDAYHSSTLHRAMGELGLRENIAGSLDHVQVSFPERGHSVFAFNSGYNKKLQEEAAHTTGARGLYKRGRDDQYSFDTTGLLTTLLYPSTSGHGRQPTLMPDGSEVTPAAFGSFVPRSPGTFEHLHRVLVPKDMPEEHRDLLRKQNMMVQAFTLVDDYQQGPSMQRVAEGAMGSQRPMRYFNIQGPSTLDNWPGPGVTYAGPSRDDPQWDFWQRWYDTLTADEEATR